MSREVVLASGNAGKLREFEEILNPLGYTVVFQKDVVGPLEVEEMGDTFEENALLKAQAVFDRCGKMVISDDSGVVVDALGGAPGVHTARYAGPEADNEKNIDKLLYELRDVPEDKRTARFVSVVCCILPDGSHFFARGECEGRIGFERRGQSGFGYDPVFLVGDKSYAEMSDEEKNAISHRGKASRLFVKLLKEREKQHADQ